MEKHYISNKNESIRLFKNDIIDYLSRVHWSAPLIVYIPIILYFIYYSYSNLLIAPIKIFDYYIIGIFFWSLTEYLMHRFVFHYIPDSELGKRIHFSLHGIHHAYPNDSKRLVMVPGVSLPLAFLFFCLFYLTLGKHAVFAFNAGFLSGYLCYDMIHYAIHHNRFKSKFWLYIKKNHMRHHFSEPDEHFGVSMPLWDFVFGTYSKEKIKRKTGRTIIIE